MTSFDASSDTDQRRARIIALAQILQGQGLDPQVAESDPLLGIPRPGDTTLLVRCDPRASDGGRLWFYSPPGHPIVEADDAHLQDAVVALKSHVRVRM